MAKAPLLEIKNLRTHFHIEEGVVQAVEGVSFTIDRGETLCVVGESGCGKSVTAMSILQLLPMPPAVFEGGEIVFKGESLLSKTEPQMRKIRGNEISMIFQEPMTSLNPIFRVGDQIAEALILHQNLNKKVARQRTIEMLTKVGIPSPDLRVDDFPHQLSGGMKQRVMIAMALACNPSLLIADEPTTALDVTIQAQILQLLRNLKRDDGMSILLITHDLGVVAEMADRVVVMYAGRVVEEASVNELFLNPQHPYTLGLFQSLPRVGHSQEKLSVIEGNVPNPLDFPSGCKFHTRCPYADAACQQEEPTLQEVAPSHQVACSRIGKFEAVHPFADFASLDGKEASA